jgi:hypothetical protein
MADYPQAGDTGTLYGEPGTYEIKPDATSDKDVMFVPDFAIWNGSIMWSIVERWHTVNSTETTNQEA